MDTPSQVAQIRERSERMLKELRERREKEYLGNYCGNLYGAQRTLNPPGVLMVISDPYRFVFMEEETLNQCFQTPFDFEEFKKTYIDKCVRGEIKQEADFMTDVAKDIWIIPPREDNSGIDMLGN